MSERTLAYLACSARGLELAERIAAALGGTAFRCGGAPAGAGGPDAADTAVTLAGWTKEQFGSADGLIYVCAAGIAVRAIAPYVTSKTTDPAVVVVDERGKYAVPVLSGHLGGANDLAREIAACIGAEAVLTTATDAGGVFAVDEWARHQGCRIANPARIKSVSSALLADKPVRICSDYPVAGVAPEGILPGTPEDCDVRVTARSREAGAGTSGQRTSGTRPAGKTDAAVSGPLWIHPRTLVLGVGCRRGASAVQIERLFRTVLAESGYAEEAVALVSSIDRKADEEGILLFCREHGFPFETFSAEELAAAELHDGEGSFSSSAYVQSVVGVDNVCERAAVLGCVGKHCGMGEGEASVRLACRKRAADGVTIALAEMPFFPDWRWNLE